MSAPKRALRIDVSSRKDDADLPSGDVRHLAVEENGEVASSRRAR
jgi:hypothetical protein